MSKKQVEEPKKPDIFLSTRNLGIFPDISDLKKICQSIALINVLFQSEDYWFNSTWDENSMVFGMNDGQGAYFHIYFVTTQVYKKYSVTLLNRYFKAFLIKIKNRNFSKKLTCLRGFRTSLIIL